MASPENTNTDDLNEILRERAKILNEQAEINRNLDDYIRELPLGKKTGSLDQRTIDSYRIQIEGLKEKQKQIKIRLEEIDKKEKELKSARIANTDISALQTPIKVINKDQNQESQNSTIVPVIPYSATQQSDKTQDNDKMDEQGYLGKLRNSNEINDKQYVLLKPYESFINDLTIGQKQKLLKALKKDPDHVIEYIENLQNKDTSNNDDSDEPLDEAKDLYNDLLIINKKIKNKERLTQIEYDKIKNIDDHIENLENNEKVDKKIIEQLKKFKRTNINEKSLDYIDENPDLLRDSNKVYFDDYIGLFKMCMRLFTYLCIFLIIFILLLSIVALLKLIYDIIVNVVSLFVNNDNLSRSLSLDYLSKTVTRCTKDNFGDDRFYIITEQKQNLIIFNIGIYVLYLLLLYLFVYFILFIYSKVMEKPLIGDPQALFNPPLFITLMAFIIGYCVVHLFLYKTIFKEYIYSPYKELQLREKEIDDKIAEYIIIYATDSSGNIDKNQVLVDHTFFEILYDASRIDELNQIFLDGVKTEDKDECLEQKIMIYNIYCYLREYIPFTKDMQDRFKDYCTTTSDNKPKFTDSDIPMTFVAMLNNNEVKMIRKFNEDLNYYNEVPDDKLEYFNKLNSNITDKIKKINLLILTNTNTMVPFFLTIFYIIAIVIVNFIILYIIIFIITTNQEQTIKEFNPYIYLLLDKIRENIYNPIINYILGNYK